MAFSDLELLARLIQCEAGGEGDTGMAAVASVVMNRVRASTGEYARVGQGSIRNIILQPGQFTCAQETVGGRPNPQNIYNMLRQKVAGDYLHTASIFDKDFHVFSGVNAPNDYHGPMTGYQLSEERWEQIKNIPNAIRPEDI